MSKLYAVGDRRNGIMFIRTDPQRIIHIPRDQIESYAAEAGCTVDEVFTGIAKVLGAEGTASFAGITDIADGGWDVSRFFTMPEDGEKPELYSEADINDCGWDVSRFFTMPAEASDTGIAAVADIEDDRWDVSRFFTMPAAGLPSTETSRMI